MEWRLYGFVSVYLPEVIKLYANFHFAYHGFIEADLLFT